MVAHAWGKKNSDGSIHRLEYHCADVAACFEAIISIPIFRQRLECANEKLLSEAQISRLTALVFLHDVGKLNSCFQLQTLKKRCKAGHLKTVYAMPLELKKRLFEEFFTNNNNAEQLYYAVLAHHGFQVQPPNNYRFKDAWQKSDNYDPEIALNNFIKYLKLWFPLAFSKENVSLPDNKPFVHAFAGLVMLADWLGSDYRFFEFCDHDDNNYIERARQNAENAVKKIGLAITKKKHADLNPKIFGQNFSNFNTIQQEIKEISSDERLVILESETGSGKTEAAFIRFAQLFVTGKVDSLYFAVPTRSAATQLHGRLDKAFNNFVNGNAILAVPGYIRIGDYEGHSLPDWQVQWHDNPNEIERAERWTAERPKRYLAAQCAVGTIDQVLLSGLTIRHSHLRASTLMRSLLVVDELHASNTYMNTILTNILKRHCNLLGGYALLMSATLGNSTTANFLELDKHTLPTFDKAVVIPYPAIHVHGKSPIAITENGYRKEIHLSLERDIEDVSKIANSAIEAAKEGAKVLVIRNAVESVRKVFTDIEQKGGQQFLMQCNGVHAPHHSRYAVADRKELDKAVESALQGRPQRGVIVIGTQTVEQSLDIDADFLITDLCPIDVLLQRIGRLHRRPSLQRPTKYHYAQCTVLTTQNKLTADGNKKLGLGSVYEDVRMLLLTEQLVKNKPLWKIPAMNRELVEYATHPDKLKEVNTLSSEWEAHGNTVSGYEYAQSVQARYNILDWEINFEDESNYCNSHEKIDTRLSENSDITLKLPTTRISPFGKPISAINVRHRDLKNLDFSDDLINIQGLDEEGFKVIVKDATFIYNRLGVQKV